MSNNIINAVKRLERAGSENSRATQKLYQAAGNVADLIETQVPVGVELPRGYYVREVCSNIGSCLFLCRETEDGRDYIDGIGRYLHGDFHCWIPGQNRAVVMQFAEDVADGLLDEIAQWLENRATRADQAAQVLEASQKEG